MKLATLVLVGLGLAATAQAQTRTTHVEMLPIPDTLPQLLFAPDSLAGTMLQPLTEPAGAVGSPQAAVPTETPPADTILPPPESSTVGVATEPPSAPPVLEGNPTVAIPEVTPEDSPVTGALPVAPPTVPPAAPGETKVHVIVENVGSGDGVVNVAVCDTGLSEEGCPYKTSVPAAQGFVETNFDNIPPGKYAVVGFHDVNGNDEFDKFLGMPREPYALSSVAAETLVPSFDDAALSIHEGDNVVIIRLKTFGGG
jgi:uncharacterized protein (DUF2141 family)